MLSFQLPDRGIVASIGSVLLVALAIEMLGLVVLHRWQDREIVSLEQTGNMASRLATAVSVAEGSRPDARPALMQALDIPGASFNWVPQTVITDSSRRLPALASMRRRLLGDAPSLGNRTINLSILPSDTGTARDLLGTVQLNDGSQISFRLRGYMATAPGLGTIIALHLLLSLAVFCAALLVLSRMLRPLRQLALAAEATGRSGSFTVEPQGPREVRRLASAFAAMQARLVRIMEENTQALISVSHDLRTPIQRMRLRASLIADPDTHDAMTSDLEDMSRFVDCTLDYVRTGENELPRKVDLASLFAAIIDDARDTGIDIAYRGPQSLVVTTRPTMIRRIMDNLIDNSRKFAARAEVSIRATTAGGVMIEIEDDGPGIPEALRERAVRPYQRLTESSGTQQGSGLGLALVDRVVSAMGGEMHLGESSLGGLQVSVGLPVSGTE